MEKLGKLYYDPKFGLSSASDLHKKLNGEFTMKQIKDFLKSQDVINYIQTLIIKNYFILLLEMLEVIKQI